MKGVKIVPSSRFNLFSITKRQKDGWILGGDNKLIWLENQGTMIEFDMKIETTEGVIFAIYIKRGTEEISNVSTDRTMKVSVNKAHELLRHPCEVETRKTAKALGWELTREGMNVCEACSIAKAKQKNVLKESNHEKTSVAGERMFMDLMTIKKSDGMVHKH